MTMGPWWCSRESEGLRLLAGLRLLRRFRWHIVGAAVFLMGMRGPPRMVSGIFAASTAALSQDRLVSESSSALSSAASHLTASPPSTG